MTGTPNTPLNEPISAPPNGLAAFTVVLLRHQPHNQANQSRQTASDASYLLLHRAPSKRLHPNLWTGIGGKVESDEYENISAAALRELEEETGVTEEQVSNFVLRRAITHARPGGPITFLCCFTGDLRERVQLQSDEGTLAWKTAEEMGKLPFIDNMRSTVQLLIADMQTNMHNSLHLGIALYKPTGAFQEIVWT